jgi:hypothetical protein
MAETAPTSQALRRAKLFWEQALLDRKGAEQKRKAKAHLESGYLNFQAALNALAAVCYLNGKFQIPNHSAARMAALCAEMDPRFEAIQEAGAALEAVQQRSPFDAEPDAAALAELSRAAQEDGGKVLDAVRSYLKERRI